MMSSCGFCVVQNSMFSRDMLSSRCLEMFVIQNMLLPIHVNVRNRCSSKKYLAISGRCGYKSIFSDWSVEFVTLCPFFLNPKMMTTYVHDLPASFGWYYQKHRQYCAWSGRPRRLQVLPKSSTRPAHVPKRKR
jgi:hypothetical protein